jgi:tRNA(Ile)-lysidine synthase TilS/MesJ
MIRPIITVVTPSNPKEGTDDNCLNKEFQEMLNKHREATKFDLKSFAKDRERREKLIESREQELRELDKYRTPFLPCMRSES